MSVKGGVGYPEEHGYTDEDLLVVTCQRCGEDVVMYPSEEMKCMCGAVLKAPPKEKP